ncbi:MAG: signal peptidase I [Nanohaloarchaea archaeon]|nr:signal peptidase I [Candidatus Nanohaloarchaea archaeon]
MKPSYIAISIAGLILLAPFLALAFPFLLGASKTFVVTSGSMEPGIPTGSVIWVSDTPPSEIRQGDVITFNQGSGNTVTHRVVNVTEEENPRFKTKGDANTEPDPGYVEPNQLVGKVNFSVPYLGYIAEWTGSSIGLILLVVIPALGIIGLELSELYNTMREEQEEDYSGF